MSKNEVELSSNLIFIVCLGIIGTCILLSLPLYFGFAGAVAFTVVALIRKGHKIRALSDMVLIGIKDCSKLLIIVTLTGATVSIWLSSGIVPTLMYYGFEYIKHINYILACFVVTAVVAVVMGTSVGTISTIGIALIGIGKGFEIPVHILLGAIVSGAFFADRISPISGIVNLMLKTVDIKYKDLIKSMLNTLIPSMIIAAAVYYFIGKGYMSVINPEKIALLQCNIVKAFRITPALLLLPLIVITMSVCGINPIINMSIGVAGGSLISIFLQKNAVSDVLKYILSGYKSVTGIQELDMILRGGGILSMAEVLFIIVGAVALSSLLEGTNIISPIVAKVMDKAKNKVSLITRTAVFSSLLTVFTCDQVVGIILLGKLLRDRFEDFGLTKAKLARTIADSGTSIAPPVSYTHLTLPTTPYV
jgi:NhaC family Na+:H+ antiporter